MCLYEHDVRRPKGVRDNGEKPSLVATTSARGTHVLDVPKKAAKLVRWHNTGFYSKIVFRPTSITNDNHVVSRLFINMPCSTVKRVSTCPRILPL